MSEGLGVRGEFRLLHKIGEGGMADVFLAERLGDDGFRTRVALKRLHRGLAMDSYFIRQLVREARLLGQLEHANIVRVFDLRRIGDEYYVVMEYVDGIDLAAAVKVHRTRKTRIPRPFFFHVALSLTESLAYAHNAVDPEGNPTPLIHRDIKPSNVMLSRRGVVKLTDFGIAHVGDGSVTGGLVQGTANYMSPEQAFGEDRLTAASDVYSLGSVFYEMLAGRPLIDGDNYLKAIHQVRERRVTIDELAQLGVEPGLRMVVAKMLSADVTGRYHEMDSVRNDLQFVADRLKIDLSWHRIRAYVGRLMGILGRAPDRVTLSNVSIPAAAVQAAQLADKHQNIGPGAQEARPRSDQVLASPVPSTGRPPSRPPSGPLSHGRPTPATPAPQQRLERTGPVTQAVQKDMLDSLIAMAQLEATGAGVAPTTGEQGLRPATPRGRPPVGGSGPVTPPTPPMRPPARSLAEQDASKTVAGPPPPMNSQFAAGRPLGAPSAPPVGLGSPTTGRLPPVSPPPPRHAPPQGQPTVAQPPPGRSPAPASAWKDEEDRTRVYDGPTPAHMGVAGTGEMAALKVDQDRTRPLQLPPVSPGQAASRPPPSMPQPPASTGYHGQVAPASQLAAARPVGNDLDDPTRFYAGAPPPSMQVRVPEPPTAPTLQGGLGVPEDPDTETETWLFPDEPTPVPRKRKRKSGRKRRRRKKKGANPRVIGLLIALIFVLIAVLVLLAAQRFALVVPEGDDHDAVAVLDRSSSGLAVAFRSDRIGRFMESSAPKDPQ